MFGIGNSVAVVPTNNETSEENKRGLINGDKSDAFSDESFWKKTG